MSLTKIGKFFRRAWRRAIDNCPSCGGTLEPGMVTLMSPGTHCRKCGFIRQYTIGGEVEYWPEQGES